MARYLAFISYRHRERDQKISGMLRRKLENWHLPKDSPEDRIAKRRKVFRDTDELPTSADLGADLEQAIAESGWLIALCSEEYVQSLWCMKEIDEFIESGRKDRILPILLNGDEETAIPASIRDLPVAADLRNVEGAALRRKVDACVAGLFGRMADEPVEKYETSERRSRFLTRSAIFAAVMTAVVGFAVYANHTAARIAENNVEIAAATIRAEEARAEAIAERNQAMLENGRLLAEQAWDAISQNDDILATQLALSALPEDLHGDEPVSEEAVSALRAAISMPGKPKNRFRFSYSVDTDFRITGYVSGYYQGGSDGMVLLDEGDDLIEHYLTFETREIVEIERTLPKEVSDHRFVSGNGYYNVAWLEEPQEGGRVRTTLNYYRDTEPIGELDLEGCPVSVSFTRYDGRVAVVDQAGTLSLFNMDAKKKAVVPGKWRSVYYPNAFERFLAIDVEGEVSLIDAISLEVIRTFESPTPVHALQYCSAKELLLAHCDDGVRIYSLSDGRLEDEILPEELPNQVLWGGYDEYLWQHEGNAIVLVYDNRVDVYEITTDLSETDYIPLYSTGVNDRCARAFYSHDGRYIYQQQYGGQLSQWDAETGALIWSDQEVWDIQGNVHDNSALSADGKALWRVNSNMTGLQKIDARTGEKLWEQEYDFSGHILVPEETTGVHAEIAFSRADYSQGIVAFRTETGEFLWQRENAGNANWSSEGDEIHCVFTEMSREEDVNRVSYCRLDPRTGETIWEKTLVELPYESSTRKAFVSEEIGIIVLTSTVKAEDETDGTLVETFSVEDGESLGTYSLSAVCNVIFSSTGVPVVRWTDDTEEADFCRVLLGGRELGPVVRADSEEGRRLTTVRSLSYDPHDRLMETGASKYVLFGGDAAMLNHADLGLHPLSITRISDGMKLLDLAYDGIAIGCDVAPDGSSICIYGYYTTPRIIKVSDPDTLVAKAKRKLEREGGQ